MSEVEAIDLKTKTAIDAFLSEARKQFPIARALLFGSRARKTHHAESDCDLAVILSGKPSQFIETSLKMADIAFDTLLETDVLIDALPIWESQWAQPETFGNPHLLADVRHEGIPI